MKTIKYGITLTYISQTLTLSNNISISKYKCLFYLNAVYCITNTNCLPNKYNKCNNCIVGNITVTRITIDIMSLIIQLMIVNHAI